MPRLQIMATTAVIIHKLFNSNMLQIFDPSALRWQHEIARWKCWVMGAQNG